MSLEDFKRDVHTRFRRLEEKVDKHERENSDKRAKLHDKVDQVGLDVTSIKTILETKVVDTLNEHGDTLYGNGSPGLKTEVDRLNQSNENRKWIVRAIGGAVLAILAKVVWDILFIYSKKGV